MRIPTMYKLPQELKEQIYRKLQTHDQRSWREANRSMKNVPALHVRLRTQLLAILKVGAVAGLPVEFDIETRDHDHNNNYVHLWQTQQGIRVFTGWRNKAEKEFTLQESEAALDEFLRRGQAANGSYILEVSMGAQLHDKRQDAETEMRAFDAAWSIFPTGTVGISWWDGWTHYARTPERTYRAGTSRDAETLLREGREVSRDAVLSHVRAPSSDPKFYVRFLLS